MKERLSSISNVAKFLDAPEDTVVRFLEEGRLGGILITALARRGVPATPNVKNSVERVVKILNPVPDVAPAEPGSLTSGSLDATATIMFTDIVGSTAITERLGDRGARTLFRMHDELVRHWTNAHGGIEVKSMGDGFMLTFPSARRGVACAVAVQKDLKERSGQWKGAQLAVRIGLAVGEPIREDDDLFGRSVSLAARISAMAKGGTIFISEIVRALIIGSTDFKLRRLGEFELKGIAGRHVLHEVVWQ